LYYHSQQLKNEANSFKQDAKLLEAVTSNPQSTAAQKVDVDALVQDMNHLQQDLVNSGVQVASDALDLANHAPSAKGTGGEVEDAIGKTIDASKDAAKTAIDSQNQVNDARQKVQQHNGQQSPQDRKQHDQKQHDQKQHDQKQHDQKQHDQKQHDQKQQEQKRQDEKQHDQK
jgi:hypothetical protein